MTRHCVALTAALGFWLGLALDPIDALAGGRPASPAGQATTGIGARPVVTPFKHHGSHHGSRHFVCCRGGIIWSPPAYYGGYGYVPAPSYASPVYAHAPSYPPAGASIALAPSPQAIPSVIEHPSGRYVLRGDGVTTPYMWVWIPNPPPPPPEPAAPPSPPARSPGASEVPRSRDTSLSRPTPMYRWVDEQGGVHWTDELETVPARYRQQLKQTPSM